MNDVLHVKERELLNQYHTGLPDAFTRIIDRLVARIEKLEAVRVAATKLDAFAHGENKDAASIYHAAALTLTMRQAIAACGDAP